MRRQAIHDWGTEDMSSSRERLEKKSISVGAISIVVGLALIVFAVASLFFLDWMKEGNNTHTMVVAASAIAGIIIFILGFLATGSALSFNSKVDFVKLERGLHENHDHDEQPSGLVVTPAPKK